MQLGPEGRVFTVRCPAGLGPGALVDIRVAQTSSASAVARAGLAEPAVSAASLLGSLGCPALLLLVLLALLVLSCSLPRFAALAVSEACNAANPANDAPLRALSFHLYRGLGSDALCSSDRADFCLSWTDLGVWSRIDGAAATSHMQYDAQFDWPAAQVLVPLAAGAVLVAALALAALGCQLGRKRSVEAASGLLMLASSLTLLAWVLSFSGLNGVAYSSTLSSSAWTNFFRSGYSLRDVISGSPNPIPPSPRGSNCIAVVQLTEGAVILSVATAMTFVTSVAMCCLRCFVR